MGNIRVTFLSDTHNKHKQVTGDLPGGDILLHSGDLTSMGYEHEIREFCKWFNNIEGYTHKVFIAGNHPIAHGGRFLQYVLPPRERARRRPAWGLVERPRGAI